MLPEEENVQRRKTQVLVDSRVTGLVTGGRGAVLGATVVAGMVHGQHHAVASVRVRQQTALHHAQRIALGLAAAVHLRQVDEVTDGIHLELPKLDLY